MPCTKQKASAVCCVATTLVVIGVILYMIKWMTPGDTTDTKTTVSGNDNKVTSETKHEVSLLHIENLASGQRLTNSLTLGGFVLILLLAGYSLFHHRTIKTSRRRVKDLERTQLLEKIQVIEDEMIKRGFLARKKGKRSKKEKKRKVKDKVKMSKLQKADDIEAQKDDSDSEDDSEE